MSSNTIIMRLIRRFRVELSRQLETSSLGRSQNGLHMLSFRSHPILSLPFKHLMIPNSGPLCSLMAVKIHSRWTQISLLQEFWVNWLLVGYPLTNLGISLKLKNLRITQDLR